MRIISYLHKQECDPSHYLALEVHINVILWHLTLWDTTFSDQANFVTSIMDMQ